MNKIVFFWVLLSIVSGCKTSKPPVLAPTDPGWQTFNYPRTTWSPGYVFRIPEGGTLQEVTTLHSDKAFDTGYAYIPGQYQKKTFDATAFLKFLFLNPSDSTIKGRGNRTIEIAMNVGRAFSESLDEPTIDNLVKNSGINWRDNNRYFIIQATLSTKQIRYKALNTGGFDFKTILNFKAGNVAGRISRDKSDSTYLDQDFDANYRIYYRAIEINPMGAASSNNKKFTYKLVTTPIVND